MKDTDLKKLSRTELLEMLLELNQENESLREELAALQRKLEERAVLVNEAGSIAQAALALNGVFESAQAAAEQYLENIRLMSEKQSARYAEIEEEAKKSALAMMERVEQECRERERQADAYCAERMGTEKTETD